MLNYKQNLIT